MDDKKGDKGIFGAIFGTGASGGDLPEYIGVDTGAAGGVSVAVNQLTSQPQNMTAAELAAKERELRELKAAQMARQMDLEKLALARERAERSYHQMVSNVYGSGLHSGQSNGSYSDQSTGGYSGHAGPRLKQAAEPAQARPAMVSTGHGRLAMIAMRLHLPEGSAVPFPYFSTAMDAGKVFVFILIDGQPVTLSDDAAIFPSDGLIGQIRLLMP